MKNRKMRISLLLALCLLIASLVTVLIVSAEDGAGTVTVSYPNGVSETYAEGETLVPLAVPKDFARYDEKGDAYVYTVKEGAAWSFVLNGEALTELTVTDAMLGKTVYADIEGTMGTEKVFYTVHENIKDTTVPEELRGEFFFYGYDVESLLVYLSRSNNSTVGPEGAQEPRYRYLRQQNNVFHITMYTDMYPTKFDPRWGAAGKEWELKDINGNTVSVQDRTWRGEYGSDGIPDVGGNSAKVYFNLNGHTLEIGSSESMHFGSMACTPYSMRFYLYSTVEGAVFSGAKSYASFYSDDDCTIYVGELDANTVKYGKNLSVYSVMVTHLNYGGGVYLYGGRYYQVGANPDYLNVAHRLYAMQNCEFYLSDQSHALLFFNDGYKSGWSVSKTPITISDCVFYVGQNGTEMIREVSAQDNKTHEEKPPVDKAEKLTLVFNNCQFYGIPTPQKSNYFEFKYTGNTVFSVGTDDNWGEASSPAYISYLKTPRSERELVDITGIPFKVYESCAILPASEVACVQYFDDRTYWQPGAIPFVYDKVVITEAERYVLSEGRYVGVPEALVATKTYYATDVIYGKKTVFAFVFQMDNGVEGYGLVGETPKETGDSFAAKVGNLSDISITLYADLVLSSNVDFGTKGSVLLDMNGYSITVAEDARAMGAVHRIGGDLDFRLYSSRPGSVYQNLSDIPVFSLGHGGKPGSIALGDYEYKVGEIYSGYNVSYISRGSFFRGFPLTEENAQAMLTVKNVAFRYTGSDVAFVLANQATLEYCKFILEPSEEGATPVAIATRADAVASAVFTSPTFSAPDGTEANLFTCVDKDGNDAFEVSEKQRLSFSNPAFYNVTASQFNPLDNVETTFLGKVCFNRIDLLDRYYAGDLPQGHRPARASAEFYLDGVTKRVPLWVYAAAENIVEVTFDSGSAGLGSFTEEWAVDATACQPDFTVDGIFIFSYGARTVAKGAANKLTAACKNLAPGALKLSLALTGRTALNLWLPKDTPILSVAVGSTKVQIVSSLDYRGDYYLVQIPLTHEMLLGELTLFVENENRTEQMKFHLASYVKGLLENDQVSLSEKSAAYALMELAETSLADTKKHGLSAPAGYVQKTPHVTEAPTLPAEITEITFDTANGAALKIRGTAGTAIALVFANGERVEKTIGEDGECSFTELPVRLYSGGFTVECGGATFAYGVDQYKAAIKGVDAYGDLLATYFFNAAAMLSGAAS